MEMIPVTCSGQFVFNESGRRNMRQYQVEVQLPAEEVDRAQWFIKKHLIDEAIQGAYPEYGFVRTRTCYIETHLPEKVPASAGDVIEDMDDVQEDMFDDVQTVVDEDDEFADVGEVVLGKE